MFRTYGTLEPIGTVTYWYSTFRTFSTQIQTACRTCTIAKNAYCTSIQYFLAKIEAHPTVLTERTVRTTILAYQTFFSILLSLAFFFVVLFLWCCSTLFVQAHFIDEFAQKSAAKLFKWYRANIFFSLTKQILYNFYCCQAKFFWLRLCWDVFIQYFCRT